jgi:thioredoxin 1
MSDTEHDEERDAIRARKAQELSQQTTTASDPVHVESPTHLQELIQDGVTLVDFHAEWCGPCKMLAPTVAEIAAESEATVAKVDIDDLQAIAREYSVRGVPTVYLFANGEPVEQWVGVQSKETYVSAIEAAV